MSDERKFLRVVDWEHYQYTEIRKKPDPPWPWFKIQCDAFRGPEFGRLTLHQRGALVGMLYLAARTGNRIEHDARWILTETAVDARSVRTLISLGFLEEIEEDLDSSDLKDLRRIYSGGAPERRRNDSGETPRPSASASASESACASASARPELDDEVDDDIPF